MGRLPDNRKIRYIILKEILSKGSFTSKDLDMTKRELEDFLLGMQKDGLIEGIVSTKDRLYLTDVRVTLFGEEYMENNSDWARGYRKAKEVRDWIPFIYN